MKLSRFVFAIAFALALSGAQAAVITTSSLHVGGFFDGGVADNKIEHQNYFVGYGTVGGVRTTQRRSFFWYHVPDFAGDVMDVSIKLKMHASTSLIFGLTGDPSVHDATETFQLGATPISPLDLTDPTLSSGEAQTIFDALDDHPVAHGYDFIHGFPYEFPFAVEIHLDEGGKALISSHRGGDVVLTGWMPTWTSDLRMDGTGHFVEADELLFGLSDVPGLVPPPELSIAYAAVPEPASTAALAIGLAALLRKYRRG